MFCALIMATSRFHCFAEAGNIGVSKVGLLHAVRILRGLGAEVELYGCRAAKIKYLPQYPFSKNIDITFIQYRRVLQVQLPALKHKKQSAWRTFRP